MTPIMHVSRPRPALWSVAPVVGLVMGLVYMVLPPTSWSELGLYDGAVLSALALSLLGWRRSAGSDRTFAAFVSVSLGLFLLGELLWWWFTVQGVDPYPSVADAAFVLGYVPLALAAAAITADHRVERDRSAWLDAGVLTAVAGLVVWEVLMQPYTADSSASLTYTLVTLAYPLADLLVLGFLLRLVLVRADRSRRATLFSLGCIATLTADLTFAYQDLQGSFAVGTWVDLMWIMGYVLIAAATVAPATAPSPQLDDAGLGRGRLVTVLLSVLVPQGVLLVGLSDADLLGLNTVTIAVAVATLVLVLASLRMWGLLGRARRIEQRRGSDRLSAVIHHSADAILLLDADLRIGFASPAIAGLTGVDPESCLASPLTSWFSGDDPAFLQRQMATLAGLPTGAVVPLEGRFVARNGVVRLVEGTACNLRDDHSTEAFVVTLRDVSVRRELESQLERRAFHDELTGLPNRSLFADRVNHALQRSARHPGRGLAVVFIDLDDFKAVNDGMGHEVGDELLRKVGGRLRACLRGADTIARFGGDEFAVLLEDLTGPDEAMELAGRLVEVLQLPMDVADIHLGVPASVGVAFAVAESTVDSLLRDADLAMYSAKAQGKCRVAMFDDDLRRVALRRLEMKVELPQALALGQLRLVYQPVRDIGGGQGLRGVEALLRWDHPTRGTVAPLDFIPLAEETGDIVAIGRWVLETACRQAARWNDRSASPLTMSVNVSAVQLHEPRFLDDLRAILDATGLPGHLLTVELTESVLVEHQRVVPILDELRRLKVGIAIDDFGTGYSSLSYLGQFPVTSVKIDRSFIAKLTATGDASLVRSILAMAEAIGLTSVAEGVETTEQLQILEGFDCSQGQGFYLGRPQLPGQIDALLGLRAGAAEGSAEPAAGTV